jgi:FkbM family methyltransferase
VTTTLDTYTPNGHRITLLGREDTNDHAIAMGILLEDEYHLHGLHLTGQALDVGAHIGTIGIALALDNPGLEVIAIEPVPSNADLVRANVRLNGLSGRVQVLEAAATAPGVELVNVRWGYRSVGVDDSPRVMVPREYVEQCRYVGNIFDYPDGEWDGETVTAKGVSLDDLPGEFSFLKIYCEGCEFQFFRSDQMARVERIVGEYHDGQLVAELWRLLARTHDIDVWSDGAVGLFSAVRR